jgi:hypothetical protein
VKKNTSNGFCSRDDCIFCRQNEVKFEAKQVKRVLGLTDILTLPQQQQQQQQQQETKVEQKIVEIKEESKVKVIRNDFKKRKRCENPIEWSVDDMCSYLSENNVDQRLIKLVNESQIDGQAFLLLNLPTLVQSLNLKLGPSLKLANLVEKLKIYFLNNFDRSQQHGEVIIESDESSS